jgi:hypothetical protein
MKVPLPFRKPEVFIDSNGTLQISRAAYLRLRRIQIDTLSGPVVLPLSMIPIAAGAGRKGAA